ncbi:MAG: TIGR00282 family metallophosphoesterase [Candidatus Omnitrophica bacterium]|nr:TIGR00282 family metallophosphoesterase [Candidatus Omnitrophota bacterium]
MKILFIGDIVGSPGREVFAKHVPAMKVAGEVDFVIANAENAAGGSGITDRIAKDFFGLGCDVITLGDHVWDKREVYPFLNDEPRILRPLNLPPGVPGRGSCVIDGPGGVKIGIVMLLGRTFMKFPADCPFRAIDSVLESLRAQTPNIIVDMHAETTSEKISMGWHADGRVSAVLGTHTHVQTADEKILPKGTAFITDVGMTGPYDSVIGQSKQLIVDRYLTGMPCKFEVASGSGTLCGVIVDIDRNSGKAKSIRRIQRD